MTILQVDTIKNAAGTGAPDFANGATIKGTTSSSAASTGYIGEFITSTISTLTNAATSNNMLALTSITLSAGVWHVSATATLQVNSATITDAGNMNIGRFSASTAGTNSGLDEFGIGRPTSGSTEQITGCIPNLEVRSDGTNTTVNGANSQASQTVFLNVTATYSAGTPRWRGTISARRIR